MSFLKTSAEGTMGVTIAFLILFLLGASWSCDARELMTTSISSRENSASDVSVLQMKYEDSEGGVQSSEETGSNPNMCALCEEFAAETINYLQANKTQTEIIATLHKTCSRLVHFEQQCITLVDYYVPLLFLEIGSVEPGDFCRQVGLCEQSLIASQPLSDYKCGICRDTIAGFLLKLKDPDTELEIIQLLMKACKAVKYREKKCKTLVLLYGPLILADAEKFLKSTDLCAEIHACNPPSANSEQASQMEKTSLLAVS